MKLTDYRCLAGSLAASCLLLLAAPCHAALPDPVRFGVRIELGDQDAARHWLEEGLDPNFVADRIGTGLMIAAWEGNLAMMELFLRHGADVNYTNAAGEQALQLAAWKGQTEALRWLIEHGAAVNRQGRAWSALHYAVFAGHKNAVTTLLEHGADVNARVPNGSTALMMAAREGHEDLADQLLRAGADTRTTNERGESALTWAMRHRNFRIAKLVASKSEFTEAVKAPPESFGKPTRSAPAPIAIADLLQQVRQAEAEGHPADQPRQAFLKAVEEFKQDSQPLRNPARTAPEPSALVITAKRNQASQERAELTYARPGEVSTLLQQLRKARAENRPTDELSKALLEAVSRSSAGASK